MLDPQAALSLCREWGRTAGIVTFRSQAITHQSDMMSQHVLHARISFRNAQMIGLVLESIEPRKCAADVMRSRSDFQFVLQKSQFTVQPRYPSPHRPVVEDRKEPQERIDQADNRNDDHSQSCDQRGHPEWQIVLQERPSRLVELRSFIAQRNVDCLGSRELSGTAKYTRPGMDLPCGIEQEILDRRMRVAAHDEAGLRCEQDLV